MGIATVIRLRVQDGAVQRNGLLAGEGCGVGGGGAGSMPGSWVRSKGSRSASTTGGDVGTADLSEVEPGRRAHLHGKQRRFGAGFSVETVPGSFRFVPPLNRPGSGHVKNTMV